MKNVTKLIFMAGSGFLLSGCIASERDMSTLKLLMFLVLCFVIGIYIVPTFLQKINENLNEEMLLIIAIALCFGMVLLATSSGFSSALGAFLMGSVLSETVVIDKIEKVIQPLKDFFGAVFFEKVFVDEVDMRDFHRFLF